MEAWIGMQDLRIQMLSLTSIRARVKKLISRVIQILKVLICMDVQTALRKLQFSRLKLQDLFCGTKKFHSKIILPLVEV